MSKTRMGKRVASLLLSLVMMLSLLPTTVYASMADTGETNDAIVEETTTPDANTVEDTGDAGAADEGEDGSVSEGEDGDADVNEGEGNDADPQDGEAETPVVYADEGESESAAAKVNNVEYGTLQDALDYTGAGPIYLLKDADADITVTVPNGAYKEINLNSHQLNCKIINYGTLKMERSKDGSNPAGGGSATIENHGTLQVKYSSGEVDFTMINSGTMEISGFATYTLSKITNNDGGKITITGGYFDEAPDADWMPAYYLAKQQTDGTYKVAAMTQSDAIAAGYVARVSLNGDRYYKTVQEAIDSLRYSSTTINLIAPVTEDCVKTDGDISLFCVGTSTFTGSLKCSGNITVQNGTVTLNNVECKSFTAKSPSWSYSTNVTIKDGTVENVTVEKTAYNGIAVAIEGGSYNGTVTVASEDTLTVTGGTFSSNVSDYVAKGYTYDSTTGKVTPAAPTVATIDGVKYESLDAAITAVKDGETIVVNAGEYTLPGSQALYVGKAFTIKAAKDADVSFDMTNAVTLGSAKVTFEGVTFNYKSNSDYKGLQHSDTLVYNNCVINGEVTLYANSETFNNCTFNAVKNGEKAQYNVWTYSAKAVEFNNCTFNCDGKAVNAYIEAGNAGTTAQQIVVKECTVESSKADKAFLNIKNTQHAYEVVFEGTTTVNGLNEDATTGSELFQVETTTVTDTSGKTVKVQEKATDGTLTTIYEVKKVAATTKDGKEYATLAEALAAVTETNPLTSVTADAWPEAKPVYYNGSFYATIGEILYDAQQKTGAIKPENAPDTAVIYCRPDTTIPTGKAGHPSFVTSTTIYGNNATLSGATEWDVENYYTLTKNITINLYSLNGGASVWSTRRSDYTVTVNMVDCKDAHEVLFNYGSGNGRVDVTVKNSTFLKSGGAAHGWPVSINCLGSLLVDGCTFDGVTTGVVVNVKQPSENGTMTVTVKNSTFNNVTGQDSNKGALRVTGQKACDIDLTIEDVKFTGTHADPEDITIGNVKSEDNLGNVRYTVSGTDASMTTHKIGATEATQETLVSGTTYTGTNAAEAAGDGTKDNPYTLKQLGAMSRQEYIDAQKRLNGTMYVTVGDYAYEKDGVLGNGVRDDTTGQIPDHSKINAYGENGYLGEKNDGANGKNVVFVGGSITSGVTGYKDVDNIGTSLLLALPAYTNVTFKGITFNNVMSFDYQLFTSPWSQLGELKFDGCTFNGIIVGAIAAQTLTFNGCEFKNYTNTTEANNSNPTWIRPAYGNWSKGDNEGQGDNFKSLTTINFTGNTVTSTRPVKFERIAQWEMDTTVTATGNTFDISAQKGDTKTKNVGMYFGANAKFDLVLEDNTKTDSTAALYTAVCSDGAGLPIGSTVKDTKGNEVVTTDALEWKTDTKLTLKSVYAVAEANGKQYSSLQAAIDAAEAGTTVTLLINTTEDVTISKNITLDLGGKSLTNTSAGKATLTIAAGANATVKNGSIIGGTKYYNIQNNGTATFTDVTATAGSNDASMIDNYGDLTITSGTYTGGMDTVKNEPGAKLTISGGEFTLTKGTSKGFTGVVFNYGELEISGGTFIQSHTGAPYGQAQVIHTDKSGSSAPSTVITGGTFKNLCTRSTAWVVRATNAAAGATKVSGGTFNKSVSASYLADGFKVVKNSDGTYGVELANYVVVGGIKGFEDTKFASFADAYKAIKPVLETICENDALGQGTPANAAAFDAVFTDVQDGKATLTYTITGNVTYDETGYANLLTMGRRSSHYLTDERHLINFKFVGAAANRGATLTVNSNITLPYEWWGEKLTTSISFENLTITGSAPSGLYTNQSFFEGIDFTLNNCTLKGIKIYNCANVGGSYTITNSTLDGTGASAGAYAIHLQGNETAPLNITISNNQISNYDRGINIDQKTAVAAISGNTISVNDANRSCIQLTQLASTEVKDNTLNLKGGNAFTLHSGLAANSKTHIEGNTVNGNGYLIYDDTKNTIDLTYVNNTVASTVDTTKGIYGGKTKDLSEQVDAVINGVKVAEVNGTKYESLQAAFDAAKTGDTVKLLRDITLTEQVNITKALDGLTLDGNKKTITCATATDPLNGGKSALYFGNADSKLYCTGIKIKDLTMTGTARFAIFLCGGTTTEFTNVKISGNYYIAVNLYGTHGATMTNCDISNSTTGTDKYISGVWSNVASANPLKLVSSKVDVIAINTYTTANKLEPKIFVDENSSAEIHTFDDGSVSGNKRLCVSLESKGSYTIKEYVGNEWATINVAKVDGVGYETLQAAIDAAKGGSTVRLLNNVVLAETAVFPADKTVHINLQGYNITATGTALRINGKTDIQSTGGVGTIESTGSVAVAVGDNAKVTVYSGVLKGREGAVITGTATGATIEIRGSSTKLIATDNAVIAGNGSSRTGEPNTILVKGGTFEGGIKSEGYIACGIYAPWNDNVTVSGGTFNITNGAGIVARAGTVKVTGGTFNCTGDVTGWVGDNKNQIPCAALVFDKAAKYPALTESSQILVSGGSFSTDPAANGATLATGYVATPNADGMYEVAKANPVAAIGDVKYDTLQAAINAAQATDGGATITLLTDINTSSYYEVKGEDSVTIDLNKHNITGSGAMGVFYVTAKGDLTIKGEGTVTAVEDNSAAMAVWVRSPKAQVTLEGGTYTQKITNENDPQFDLIYVEYGTVYVKGGTYEGFTPDWTLNCKDGNYPDEANIEVTGGTFKGFNPDNNTAEGEGTSFVAPGYVSTVDANGNFVVTEGAVEVWTGYTGEKKGSYATVKEAAANLGDNKWIVIGKDYTLDEDFTIPEGVFFDVAKDATLTVAEGVTLTVAANAKRLGVRTGATLVNNGTIMVLGTSSSNGYVMVQDGAKFDVAKLSVPEDHFLDYNGSNYFATANADASFEITYSDGTTKKAKSLTNITGATKVTLLKDVTDFARSFDSMDKLGDNFVLDLGGHTLSGKTTASTEVLSISVPMTIQNGTIKNASENKDSKANPGALKTYADVTIASDAIIDGGSVGYAIWTAGYGHTLTVNGTVTSNGDYAITGNGSNEYDGATIDIDDCDIIVNEGAVIKAFNGVAIYHPELGTVTINGGDGITHAGASISGHTGVQMCSGELVINGGSIEGVGSELSIGNDGGILDGAGVSIINRGYPGGAPTVKIFGGFFASTGASNAVQAYTVSGTDTSAWDDVANYVNIYGGTFRWIPDNMDKLCAEGYEAVVDTFGYTVTKAMVAETGMGRYTTLEAAIASAIDGEPVNLLRDVEQNSCLVINKSITLNLDGHKIYNTKDIWDVDGHYALVSIENNANVTITGNGTIAAKENDCYTIDVESGKLTIENGEYIGNVSVVQVQKAALVINGGTFSLLQKWNGKSTYLINCIDADYKNGDATVAISGGTFVDYDPRNNAAEGAGTSFVAEGVGVDVDADGNFTAKANMVAQLVDADGNSVAAYDTLANAFYYANDEKNPTLIVLQDIVDSAPANDNTYNYIAKPVTLDLNGHDISFKQNTEVAGFTVVGAALFDAAEFTITGKGTITADKSLAVVQVCARDNCDAVVTIGEDVTLIGAPGVMIDKYQQATPGGQYITVNIAGTVKSASEGESYAVYVNGLIKQQPVINVMSTAKIEANGWGMYLAGNNKTNIASGAQISGTVTGIEIRAGELTLDGCTVTGGSGELTADANGSGVTVRNAAIAVSQHATELPITVDVKSGTYTGTAAVYQSDAQGTASENVKVSIENGTFLGKVEAKTKGAIAISGGAFTMNVNEYCVDGFECTEPTDDDPMYYVVKADEEQIDVKRSLTLGNTLTMVYKVLLPDGYTSTNVEFEFYNDRLKVFESTIVEGTLNETSGRYEFAFTGINPQRMTDTLKATVNAKNANGETVTFAVDDYSVADYCNALLISAANANGAYDELVGNLVAYGTAAQLYQKYHTDKLVNSVVTGGKVVEHSLDEVTVVNNLTKVEGGVSIEKKTLVLNNAFAIRVKFTLEGDTTIDQVMFKVKADTTTTEVSQFETETLTDGTVYYYFDFAGLNSKQLASTVTFTAVVNGADNDVLAFSANTYLKLMSNVAGVSTELKNLLAALYNYGYTCRNF